MEVGAHPDATDEYMLYPRKVSFWNTAMTFGKTHEKKVTVTQISWRTTLSQRADGNPGSTVKQHGDKNARNPKALCKQM